MSLPPSHSTSSSTPSSPGGDDTALMTGTPRPWMYGSTSAIGGFHAGRSRLERRVEVARREASAWTAAAPNGERLGAYFTSYGMASLTSPTARGYTLADYSVLLEEWDVPGVKPPSDVGSDLAVRWARSVTLAVLRDLRRDGHLS